jgi:hypothetical protein
VPGKVRLVGETLNKSVAGAIPVPDSVIAGAADPELLAIATDPVTAPIAAGLNTTWPIFDCPGVKVSGSVRPDTENPAPAGVTCVTTRLAVPVLEIVMFFDDEVPVVTFPNVNVVGLTPIFATGETPVPARVITGGVVPELDTRVTLPLTAPAVVGANLICPTEDCAAAIVKGNENPVTVNPAPVTLRAVTVRFDPPVFWIVRFWVAEAPTVTFAKFTLTGVTFACGCGVDPVPASPTLGTTFDASLVTATEPLELPPEVGLKRMVTFAVWPAGMESGNVMP